MLLCRGGDLLVHRLDDRHRLCDCFEFLADITRQADRVLGEAATAVHHPGSGTRALLQVADQRFDLCGGLLGTLCQAAHFVGDYGETSPRLACARRLDCSVEREQIGLFGNAVDHRQHGADAIGFLVQLGHGLGGKGDFRRQPVDLRQRSLHHVVALGCLLIRAHGRTGCFFGVARHFLHRGGHFMHGGGHLIGFLALVANASAGLLGDCRQFFGGGRQLRGDTPDMANERL